MKCSEFRQLWDEAHSGVDASNDAGLEEHSAACESCRSYAADVKGMKNAIKDAYDVGLPEGFAQSLHLKLAQEAYRAPQSESPGKAAWFFRAAMGLAAAAVILVALFLVLPDRDHGFTGSEQVAQDPAGTDPDATHIPADRFAVVRITLDVEQVEDEAQIEVRLPDGVVFVGEGGSPVAQKSMQWTEPLEKGSHEIKVLVQGTRPGRGVIQAKAMTEKVEYATNATVIVD